MEQTTAEQQALYRYAEAASAVGCSRQQWEGFCRAGIVLQAKQLTASAAARLCDQPGGPTEIGYGGARGGGKSHWGLAQLADDCLRYPGLTCLLLRKVGKANRENFEELRLKVLRCVPNHYRRQEGILLFPNGSKIILGHFQHESDIDAYLGLEYDVILVEEATTLTSSKYKAIRTCNRSSKPGFRPRMYSTTNPGGVGHAWYKEKFITPFLRRKETDTRFIPATVDDNLCVNIEYRANLESLAGWQLRAWRYGDWDIAAGQFFTNFRASRDGRPWHVIPAFKVPTRWRAGLSFDYGWTHYTSAHIHAEDGDGNLYTTAEHCERKWLPDANADAIHAMLGRQGRKAATLHKRVAGTDIFSPDEEGKTTSDTYKKLGLNFARANTDRINGAAEVLWRLGDPERPEKAPPRWFIFDTCVRLIECLPALEHNPHKPEDVLKWDTDDEGVGGDDPYDDTRYYHLAVARPRLLQSAAGGRVVQTSPPQPAGNQNRFKAA